MVVISYHLLIVDSLCALQLETERGFIMSIFMQVPLVVVKRLQRTAEKSVLSLRNQMDKQHTGESDSELDDEVRQPFAVCWDSCAIHLLSCFVCELLVLGCHREFCLEIKVDILVLCCSPLQEDTFSWAAVNLKGSARTLQGTLHDVAILFVKLSMPLILATVSLVPDWIQCGCCRHHAVLVCCCSSGLLHWAECTRPVCND